MADEDDKEWRQEQANAIVELATFNDEPADLTCINVSSLEFEECSLKDARFLGIIESTTFQSVHLGGADFSLCSIQNVAFAYSDLRGVKWPEPKFLRFLDLEGALISEEDVPLLLRKHNNIENISIYAADGTEVTERYAERIAEVQRERKHSQRRREKVHAIIDHATMDGSAADLSRINVSGLNLSYQQLRGAKFGNAISDLTVFDNADLRDADFSECTMLDMPLFNGANLCGVKWPGVERMQDLFLNDAKISEKDLALLMSKQRGCNGLRVFSADGQDVTEKYSHQIRVRRGTDESRERQEHARWN